MIGLRFNGQSLASFSTENYQLPILHKSWQRNSWLSAGDEARNICFVSNIHFGSITSLVCHFMRNNPKHIIHLDPRLALVCRTPVCTINYSNSKYLDVDISGGRQGKHHQ